MKIYLAGPISGKGYKEVVGLYKEKSALLRELGFEILCPMTGKTALRNEIEFKSSGYGNPTSSNHAIFQRDKWMVKSCDIVLCDLSNSGDRVSIGSCMELAMASLQGKHVITIMQYDNIHRHCFVLEASDIVFETYEESLEYLSSLMRGV